MRQILWKSKEIKVIKHDTKPSHVRVTFCSFNCMNAVGDNRSFLWSDYYTSMTEPFHYDAQSPKSNPYYK